MTTELDAEQEIQRFQELTGRLKSELHRVIVGQDEVMDGVLIALMAGSHVLLEGVPGLGKTLMVRSLAQALDVPFARIQFTPDLMPADILGTTVIEDTPDGGHRFEFRKGPVFSSIVLADEINRATPKTQSALLEAMQEQRVTIGGTTHELGSPYFVLATQNPLEMEGTYPLPEAQLDRFLLKIVVRFPSAEELHEILDRTTRAESSEVRKILSGTDVLSLQATVRRVPIARFVQDYVVRLLRATHPELEGAPAAVRRYVAGGASPRGAQALLLAAKARALLDGRISANIEDVRGVAPAALRHRILINFEGVAEGKTTDAIISELLSEVPAASS